MKVYKSISLIVKHCNQISQTDTIKVKELLLLSVSKSLYCSKARFFLVTHSKGYYFKIKSDVKKFVGICSLTMDYTDLREIWGNKDTPSIVDVYAYYKYEHGMNPYSLLLEIRAFFFDVFGVHSVSTGKNRIDNVTNLLCHSFFKCPSVVADFVVCLERLNYGSNYEDRFKTDKICKKMKKIGAFCTGRKGRQYCKLCKCRHTRGISFINGLHRNDSSEYDSDSDSSAILTFGQNEDNDDIILAEDSDFE